VSLVRDSDWPQQDPPEQFLSYSSGLLLRKLGITRIYCNGGSLHFNIANRTDWVHLMVASQFEYVTLDVM
jgi:hypothetical protein